jgi:PAS domain S-box-containing protein
MPRPRASRRAVEAGTARSAGDGQALLDAIAEAAAQVSDAPDAWILRVEGDRLRLVARHGARRPPKAEAASLSIRRTTVYGRAVLDGRTIQVGAQIAAPLWEDGTAIGAIAIRRATARPLSGKQRAALESFARQAALVVRQLEISARELAETRKQQTASGEILRAISSASADMQRVFDMIAANALRLCEGQFGGVFQFDGRHVHLLAQHGLSAEGFEVYVRAFPRPAGRDSAIGRALLDRAIVHIPDVQRDPEYGLAALAATGSMRCIVAVPVLRDGHPIGGVVAWRSRPELFTDEQVELLKTFADQTLIAIENARLVATLQERNQELTAALEQQTATAEILRAISASPTDLQPILDTVVRAAARFCAAPDIMLLRLDGAVLRGAAGRGRVHDSIVRQLGHLAALELPVTRESVSGRAVVDRQVVHVHDLIAEAEDEFPEGRELARRFGHRTTMATPLLREGVPVGAIVLFRDVVDPFSDRQLELLRLFADQAVIAIENVRLFTELGARNHDLTEALEQQTATSEILRAISSSPTDVQPVFDTIADSAARLCEADFSVVMRLEGGLLHLGALNVSPEERVAYQSLFPRPPGRHYIVGRAVVEGRPVHIEDVTTDPAYDPRTLEVLQRAASYRTYLGVPILRNGAPIGVIGCGRRAVRPFTPAQVELVKTFADQAVIAIENVRLFHELDARNRALTETLEQQTATGEILRIISTSPTDTQPVFDTLARSVVRLCQAAFGYVFRFDGTLMHVVAHHNLTPEALAALERQWPMRPDPRSVPARAVLERRAIHVVDVLDEPDHPYLATSRALGIRTMLTVPMLRDGQPIGAIAVYRQAVQAFSEQQVALVETFADQAVIAIENVRLFTELEAKNRDLTETLEQQTATSDILRVISGSPTDVQPVFDTIAKNARRLCAAEFCAVFRFDGNLLHFVAHDGVTAEGVEAWRRHFPVAPGRGSGAGRAVLSAAVEQIPDVDADPHYQFSELARIVTFRSLAAVPILRDGRPIGAITVNRSQTGLLPKRQVELLNTFADQAVIAIENVRLFKELEARNRDLTETLEQQTATAEILRVISSSPTDVQPVFDTIAQAAHRLCDAESCAVFRYDGQLIHYVAHHGLSPEGTAAVRDAFPTPADRGSAAGRAVLTRAVAHIPDVHRDAEYAMGAVARIATFRSIVAVPMLRDGAPIGVITVRRPQAGPFSDRYIALLETFADQAVIAVENVRLFTELDAKNRDLTETLEQQTATAEILRVISSSPTDAQPVFDTIATSALRLCDAIWSAVTRFDGHVIELAAHHGLRDPAGIQAVERAFPRAPSAHGATDRAIVDRAVGHYPDVLEDPNYQFQEMARAAGYRSMLAVPMLREGTSVGAITVAGATARTFSDRQIELLKTFADQAVIAIENVRLFTELDAKNRDLTETLEQQKATAEILRVIAGSPTDAQPVFDVIAESAVRLIGAEVATVTRFDGEWIHIGAIYGSSEAGIDALRHTFPMRPSGRGGAARAVRDRAVVHISDVLHDPEYGIHATALTAGFRSILGMPMLREGSAIGAITLGRAKAGEFTGAQIQLLRTFADQAVIAIENVRLFKELEARNAELTGTLARQTATGEVLRAISRAQTDAQPVFDIIAASARRLCSGGHAGVWLYDGELIHLAALDNVSPEGAEAIRRDFPRRADKSSTTGRALLTRTIAQIPDVLEEPGYELKGQARTARFRSFLAAPMLRDGEPIGVIGVGRPEPGPFPEQQIELLKTFADQAVIAIENVRLFTELEARTHDLTRSVGELKALGEVSQAVSSTLDLETVLETIVRRAVELSDAAGGAIYGFDEVSQEFRLQASHRMEEELLATLRASPLRLGEGTTGQAALRREPVEVADIADPSQYGATRVRTVLVELGYHSLLSVPLLQDQRILGALTIWRRVAGRFPEEVVNLLRTLATQSSLAIHNAGLFREIQRRKQYADAIVETSPVAIVTLDLAGRVVGWNPGAERLFGYAEPQALGRPLEDLVATSETREEVRSGLQQGLRGERSQRIGRRARNDGTFVDVEISATPVVVDGAEVGIVATYHDITDLLRARREAEAANEAKSAFLATMSHEIRTPLNAVIGMSGLLLNTPLADEQREYAEIVRQSGDALLTVINDILDFSKIEAGRLELEAQPFDLRECVEGTLDLVATRAAEKGLDLAYVMGDGTPPAIVGDVTRLRQVLLNLLSNAVKFTERGEVVVSVHASRLDGADGLHELTFSVRDTGIGIAADRIGRLFQSFSQVDASTTRRYGGTGLGLAISQRLTELMGGRINVTSEPGVGSEFRFAIRAPAAGSLPAQTRRDLSGIQHSIRGKHVLVVDDNATNRRIVTTHLGTWGLPARATASPLEAAEWIRAGERFDVGILDMHMPEMDGVALARAIRAEPAGAALPLILFTSLGRREARAEEEGFAAYLHKPIKPSQLFDALVSVLGDQPVHVRERGVARTELDPDMARRHPLRILLAEDNVVNQKVALRLLAQMGYRADVAANGLEAVDAVGRQTYDVVLMDVQMPELDGFEASREINRRWPRERRPRIVAMTANAMQGDRELCVAAGMDDYVAKPVRVEELVTALERTPRRETEAVLGVAAARTPAVPAPGAGTRAPEGAPAADAIDRATFDGLTRSMGGAFVAELIDTFVEDARELTAQLPAALTRRDVDGFRRAAHSLKSTSESLGAIGLAALARDLEAIARGGRLDGVEERLGPVAAEYARVAHTLRKLRRDLPA